MIFGSVLSLGGGVHLAGNDWTWDFLQLAGSPGRQSDMEGTRKCFLELQITRRFETSLLLQTESYLT